MARFIMILVLGAIITYGVTSITLNEFTSQGTENSVDSYSYNRARDIANGMADIVLMRIANVSEYRMTSPQTEDLSGGYASFTAEDTFFEGDSLIKIVAAGTFNGVSKTITVYTEKLGGWVPPVLRGAWTANASLDNTISDMYIDGRNHDINGNLIPNSGTYGVSTSTNFANTQNAAIGGTEDSVDYPMTFPEVPNVIEENYNWGGTFPQSPDEILGYPEGTLKAASQSGQFGSQYVLNPSEIEVGGIKMMDGLSYPFSGITYIELTDGVERKLYIHGNGNSGIVVVHGPNASSHITHIKFDDSIGDGVFTGLLVTDYSFHHHIDILGGVLMLSPNLEAVNTCDGNQDHWVYYSTEAISAATEIAIEITGLSGKMGYGFGKKRLNVKHWYE